MSLISDAWTEGSKSTYQNYINKWAEFCKVRNLNQFKSTIQDGADFLVELYETGVGYSVINTARSALSAYLCQIDGYDFGKHPVISKVLKGVFRNRPSLPRYVVTYNIDTVFHFLANLPDWNVIPLIGSLSGFVHY